MQAPFICRFRRKTIDRVQLHGAITQRFSQTRYERDLWEVIRNLGNTDPPPAASATRELRFGRALGPRGNR